MFSSNRFLFSLTGVLICAMVFIIDADQTNLASSQEQNIGHKNLLITQETKYLNMVYVPLASDLVMVHTYDLTKRERAEEALHKSEQYNSMLFEESTIELAL